MRHIRDKAQLEAHLMCHGIRELFDTEGIEFELFSYERGEIIPKPFEYVFFLVSGEIRVYALFETGETVQINRSDGFMVVGDLEFAGTSSDKNFYEAATDCELVGVSLRRYGDELRRDVRFLWALIDSINAKLWTFDPDASSLGTYEERLLAYFRLRYRGREITGLKDIAQAFNMSERHLLRVMRALVEKGDLVRVARGRYLLA